MHFRNAALLLALLLAGPVLAPAQNTLSPEDVAKMKRSYTGQFLAPVLARRDAKRRPRTEAAE